MITQELKMCIDFGSSEFIAGNALNVLYVLAWLCAIPFISKSCTVIGSIFFLPLSFLDLMARPTLHLVVFGVGCVAT